MSGWRSVTAAVSARSETSYRGAPPMATLVTIEEPAGGRSDGRVQRDAQTWWAIVQQQMESGLSQVAFCAAEGLSVSSLQNWKRKFVREGRISQAPAAVSAPWFAELAVPTSGVEPESTGDPVPPAWQIELELGAVWYCGSTRTEPLHSGRKSSSVSPIPRFFLFESSPRQH